MNQYMLYGLSAIIAIIPAIFWLVIWYLKDFKEPEPKKMIARSFIFGVMGIIPFLGIAHVLDKSTALPELWAIFSKKTFFIATVILSLVLAFLEEFVKHFAVLRLGHDLKIELNQIVDGAIYSVSAALGFAFAENVFYFANAIFFTGTGSDFLQIFVFRSFGTMLAHTIFSGVFGLFWGYSYLSMKITPHHNIHLHDFFKKIWETLNLHIIRNHVLKNEPDKDGHEKAELVAEGLLLATLLHGIFNILIELKIFGTSFTFLVVPLIMGGFFWLSKQFLDKKNIKIWKKAV